MRTAFLFQRPQVMQRIGTDLQLRRREPLYRSGRGRPIAMAATLAAGTFAGAMLVPASGSAFSPAGSPVEAVETAHTTPKTSRLPLAPAIAATQAVPASVTAPGACLPSATPRRTGPIAYV
jgi:hypothetical protein